MVTTRPTDPNAAAHERVYRSLRQQVMHGELDPGHALTLRGLGKAYGVSMTPAREAVRRLVAEGALTLSSSGRISTPELTPERIEELAAIRALLEPEMAARALPRAHFALIERLAAINMANGEAAVKGDAAPDDPCRVVGGGRAGAAAGGQDRCDAGVAASGGVSVHGGQSWMTLINQRVGRGRLPFLKGFGYRRHPVGLHL